MADPIVAPVAAPTAAQAFASQAKSYGLSEAQIADTLSKHGLIAGLDHSERVDAVLDAQGDDGSLTSLPAFAPGAKYSAADAHLAYETAVKFGLGEEIRAALQHDGYTELEDGRNQAETEFDGSTLGAAADPSEYELSFVGRPTVEAADLVALDRQLRTGFAAAGVPPSMAQGLLENLLDSGDQYSAQKEGPAQQLYKAEQRAILGRLGDGDVERMVLLASLPLGRMSKDTREMLLEHGALESAVSIRRLAQVGELLLHRDSLKSKK